MPVFLFNLPVYAQGTGLLEEIVVTATKRETNLQDTAMSVSAFTGAQLEQAGATDLREMQLFTPGLWVGGNAGFGTNPIVIRGIGSLITGIGADEAVGVYVDGIFQGRTAGNIFEFVDYRPGGSAARSPGNLVRPERHWRRHQRDYQDAGGRI